MVVDSTGYFYIAGETWSYGNGSSDLLIVKMNETFSQYTTWGGAESEIFSGMVIDSNENIYIAGSTSSYGAGEDDVVLLKYSKNISLEWYRIWGENSSDSCLGIAFDSLENVYLGGSLEMIATKDLNVFIKIFDPSGNPLRSVGGGGLGDAYCKGIYAESPQNFIVAENALRFEGWDYEIILTKYIDPLHFGSSLNNS
jgi:hypothetical protein